MMSTDWSRHYGYISFNLLISRRPVVDRFCSTCIAFAYVVHLFIRPSPFFRLASNAFPDIGSVGRIEKKQTKKKINKKSQNRRPWYPRTPLNVNIHIFGLTKCTIYCKKCSCFCSCSSLCCYYAHFQIKRIISSEKWFNCLVTFFFVLKMPKIWVGRTTLNGKKKDGLTL